MHAVVCVKQVPDATDIRFDPITLNLIREGIPSIVNPPDLHAVEEAIRLKEKFGAHVSAIAMGPMQSQDALREVLAMGVDDAYLISDRDMAGADTLATSYVLWKGLSKIDQGRPIDVILHGKVAIDGETGQVPPGNAVRLGIPIITSVTEIEKLDQSDRVIVARRRFEDGVEIVGANLPVALTITEDANKPRRPNIDGILAARKAKITIWDKKAIEADPSLIGLKGSPTIVMKIFAPPGRQQGEVFDGSQDPKAAAKWLVDKLLAVGAIGGTKQHETPHMVVAKAPAVPSAASAEITPAQARLLEGAKAPEQFGEVWVFIEQIYGKPSHVSWELLGEGARLAKVYGVELAGVVLGHNMDEVVKQTIAYGADKVYVLDDPVLETYRTQPYAYALAELSKRFKPEAILVGGTLRGRDMAGAAATILETGLIADCTALDVDLKTGTFLGTRPDYGGNLMSTIICPEHRPTMVTVRHRVMKALLPDNTRKAEIIQEHVIFRKQDLNTELIEWIPIEKVGIKLEEAEAIVSGGRGLGSAKNFYLVEQLAEAIGGKVGASRAAVRAGWIEYAHQVGQTGFTVRPRLYVAVGVSGAIQHIVGMMNSDYIVAINRDRDANIFKMADFGVVGDLFKVVPAIVDELRERGLAKTLPAKAEVSG